MIRNLLRRKSRQPEPHPFNCHNQARQPWIERTEAAARLIRTLSERVPVQTVADIGCGDRKLGAHLRGFDYHGFDMMPQSRKVSRFDVQRDRLPETFDVAVLLGVTEYLGDPESVLRRLSALHLIVSHAALNVTARERNWRTNLPADQFEALIERAGFTIAERITMESDGTSVWLADRIYHPPIGAIRGPLVRTAPVEHAAVRN